MAKRIYDRQSKKWLTDEEYQRKYKKRQTCKGGREHDWVQVLPYGVEALPHYKGDPEIYYRYEQEIEEFTRAKRAEMEEKHGIKSRYSSGFSDFRKKMRNFVCSVCLKQKYETSSVEVTVEEN